MYERCFLDCGKVPLPEGASMMVYRGVHSTMSLTCSDDYIATGDVDAKCLNSVWDLGDFNCWWKRKFNMIESFRKKIKNLRPLSILCICVCQSVYDNLIQFIIILNHLIG